MQRREDLAPARIDQRQASASLSRPRLPDAECQRGQGADRYECESPPLGEGSSCGDADAQAGERPRSDANGDRIDSRPAPGLRDGRLDLSQQGGSVARAPVGARRSSSLAEQFAVERDGDGRVGGCRIDAEESAWRG